MRSPHAHPVILCWLITWLTPAIAAGVDPPSPSFSVATYNLENYITTATASRSVKPEAARHGIDLALRSLSADVLALQEVGGTNALLELRDRLRRQSLDYPHWEIVRGYDTNIHVAVLSRFPITERRSHPDEGFLLRGRRFRTSRGIVEVDIAAAPAYRFTLMVVHLKSRRESTQASQEEIREQEAQVLRRLIDARLRRDPNANLIVAGDFNDLKNSRTIRTILGRGPQGLLDTRPTEDNGDDPASGRSGDAARRVAWTHFFALEDVYSRVDYILVSPGMAREWERRGSLVFAFPNWGRASDHRPVLARFHNRDR
jgi:endonuclease/exonuclease/phosphatase family metal-dependent hydrolase